MIKESRLGSWLHLEGLLVELAVVEEVGVAEEVLDELRPVLEVVRRLLELMHLADHGGRLLALLEVDEGLVPVLDCVWVSVVDKDKVSQVLSQEWHAGRVDRVQRVAVLGVVACRVCELLKPRPGRLQCCVGLQNLPGLLQAVHW